MLWNFSIQDAKKNTHMFQVTIKMQTVFQAAPSELTSQLRMWLIGDRLSHN